ncbi:cyclic nucleotide-binding domain-containing protein [Allorhizobium sp. BGMRC 0089]|uniref:cyclic nucleotide-binding domain-containing protein n=1 Tax=Allorhizobium sonneratiae TaxID=2934936 RepID=UPI0020341E68|nr:cyclic nucleotide-binding domain-containing protein [Allorhizobium sonneratiae]MCM2293336.1 cyclic nucleotide-binding domain-containing protein [Allorhizobium sonneratiae]
MALSDDMQLLSGQPLFQGLDVDQLRLIAFGAERKSIGQGQPLFRQHAPAECAYVVARGRFELIETGHDGKAHVAAVAGQGTMLSELALATMVERKYTAIALEEAEVLRIPRSLFHRLLEEYPSLGQVMQQRIRDSLLALAKGAKALEDRFR